MRTGTYIQQKVADAVICTRRLQIIRPTTIESTNQEKDIANISELLKIDTDIIALRKTVLDAAQSQLRNGVITTSAYIIELTNLNEAKNSLATHRIELELAKANYNITTGY